MSDKKHKNFLTVPRLDGIPYLVHGFGMKFFEESDFRKNAEWKGFKLLFLNQIHSDVIHILDKISDQNLNGDGVVTHLRSVFLVIKTADCLPILILDEGRKLIAAAHAGWKGTSKKVAQKVIQAMIVHYGCEALSLLVALGPCIDSGCYEVGENVREAFSRVNHSADFFRKHPSRREKYFFDLRGANISQMSELGVQERNIYSVSPCTYCHEDLLSFRREKKKSGRMLSFIGLFGNSL